MEYFDLENMNNIDNDVELHLAETGNAASIKDIDFCKIWKTVRPIILFATALLFWKPSWQKVMRQLIDSLDANCQETTSKNTPSGEQGNNELSVKLAPDESNQSFI